MPSILIIDDVAEFRVNIAQMLEFEGFEVAQADNPVDGFAQMSQQRPDLILLDLSFAGLSGHNFIEWVRHSHVFADIPIIAVSGLQGADDIEAAISSGANDYLVKPVDLAQVIECVQKHLVKD